MKVNVTKIKNVGKNKIKVKWKTNSYCDGYILEYSTNKSFKNAKSIKIDNKQIKSKTIDNLKDNKKYYLRIRTYKKNDFFAWISKNIE